MLELVHPRETLKVLVWNLMRECDFFTDDPLLLNFPYSVPSPVSVDDFCQFVLMLENKDVETTIANIGKPSLLCDELHFVILF
jgi:hypothetical protein